MIKKIAAFLTLGLSLVLTQLAASAESIKIYVLQIVEHKALDSTRDGIISALKDAGYIDGKNIELRIESAQGSPALAGQVASQYLSNNPDIVVGIGTVAAQAFSRAATQGKTKLIFSSITDPLGAGLVDSLARPGRNSSGVSNFVALEPQLELFKKILPKMQKLGVLYNPGEANSVSIIEKLRVICPKYNLILVPQIASKTSDVAQNVARLTAKSDAIFISNDNTALAALPSIVKIADKAAIPVFVSDTDAVSLGAKAALGPNQYEIGRQTGRMIVRVLQGADINDIAVEFPDKTELVTNNKKE